MRSLPYLLAAALLLGRWASSAAAEDGDRAPPEAWPHAYGPASGSARSRARAPESVGAPFWTYRAKGVLAGPPVIRDGLAYLLEMRPGGSRLVALDVETGDVWAEGAVRPSPGALPVALRRAALLLEENRYLSRYREDEGKLERDWSFAVGRDAAGPVVFGGEVYVATPSGLLRLRTGGTRPVWKAEGSYDGLPALFGSHLYAVRRRGAGWELALLQRTDGKELGAVELPRATVSGGSPARVICAHGIVAVRLPRTDGTWAMFARKPGARGPELALIRTEELVLDPLAGDSVLLGLVRRPRMWAVLRGGKRPRVPLVEASQRPDLIEGSTPCVSCSGTILFGFWAGAINGNRILWNLRETEKAFAGGAAQPAVPARDGRVLAVGEKGRLVACFGPREDWK